VPKPAAGQPAVTKPAVPEPAGTGLLIVSADDLGLTEGVNRAVLRGYRQGIVTSTSLLAVGRAFDDAVRMLLDNPGLDVGAHLAIVGEDPPLLTAREIPTLVDSRGALPLSYRTVIQRGLIGRLDPNDVRREFAAQLERIRSTGITVSHVDTHQHTHLWPAVSGVLLELARQHAIPAVRTPRSQRVLPIGVGVNVLSARLRRRVGRADLATTDNYTGLDEAGSLDQARFERSVIALGPAKGTVEINAHPGVGDDPDLARFDWNYRWPDELAMLVSTETRELIAAGGYRLGSFRDLRPAGSTGPPAPPVSVGLPGVPPAPPGVPATATGRKSKRRTGRAALAAYRGSPIADRLHARVRWWTAPFPAIESAVPSSGRILEIGCGHGLFCTYLALAQPAREVVGVDIDADKIDQARQVAEDLPGVRLSFEVGESGTVKTGPWDAIAIVDMLYLLPAAEQRALLAAAVEQLAPGGVLLVKEMSPMPRWKARWNVLQETLSVSILGITERAGGEPNGASGQSRFDFVGPAVMAGWLQEWGLSTTAQQIDRHYPHPHHLLTGRSQPV
jgi:predicted glycoside hydrolase/deacetylase ChbG (UPF0249 family)/SAM-dependent methyltransferase